MRHYSKSIRFLLAAFAFGSVLGCGGTEGSLVTTAPTTPDPTYAYMTGNWQMAATSTSQTAFSSLAGFINESSTSGATGDTTTAIFQLTPGSCFIGEETLPLTGTVKNPTVSLRSFSDSGQFVTIAGTENTAATQFTGTYTVNGGCANGTTGAITGSKYAPLSGTYAGSLSSAAPQSISLSLTQAASGNGKGFSALTGSATFSGFSCFAKGVLQTDESLVLGSSVQISILTDNNQVVTLNGTSDVAAKTITVSSGNISGASGACNDASLGTLTLTHS